MKGSSSIANSADASVPDASVPDASVPDAPSPQGPVVGDQIRSLYSAHQAEIARRKLAVEKEYTDTETKTYTGFSHLKSTNSDGKTFSFTDADQQYFVFNISHSGLPPLIEGNDPGIRICGVFSTLEEAHGHAHLMSSDDSDCCVLVAPMQQWVVLGSTPELLSNDAWCKEQRQRLLQKHDKEIIDRDVEFANRRCKEDTIESDALKVQSSSSQPGSAMEPVQMESNDTPNNDSSKKRYHSHKLSRNLEVRNQNVAVMSVVRDEEGSNPAHLMFSVWMAFDTENEANSWIRNVAGDQIIHHSLDTVDMYQWLFPQSATDEKIRNCTYRNSEEQTIMSFASQQSSTVEGFKRFCEADGINAPAIEI